MILDYEVLYSGHDNTFRIATKGRDAREYETHHTYSALKHYLIPGACLGKKRGAAVYSIVETIRVLKDSGPHPGYIRGRVIIDGHERLSVTVEEYNGEFLTLWGNDMGTVTAINRLYERLIQGSDTKMTEHAETPTTSPLDKVEVEKLLRKYKII